MIEAPAKAVRAAASAALATALLAVPGATLADSGERPSSAAIIAAMDSVVSVLPDWPREHESEEDEPEGSGVVVLDGRSIITAGHVIGPSETMRVRTEDGRILPARLVGTDFATDLSLLRIEEALTPAKLAGEATLGAPVCAIGNVFGLGLSVSCGTVSAVHRAGVGFNAIEDFVQTDAAVNPGASGGALIDEQGRVIGILSAIFTKSMDANIGVNFAVSAPLVRKVARALAEDGQVRWRPLGAVLTATPAPGETGRRMVEIIRVVPNGPAAVAGLRGGDRILRMGARRVMVPADVTSAYVGAEPGEVLRVAIERDGKRRELFLVIPDQP